MGVVLEGQVVTSRGEELALSYHPAGEGAPAVVVCHGMESHRRGKVARIAEALQRAGIAAVRFDHAGCGDSAGPHHPICVHRRGDDVDAVLGWLESRAKPAAVGLAGSSMGAAVSLMGAARHGIARWAGIATPVGHWPEVGPAAASYRGTSLLIWGDADEVVPPADSESLVERWGARAETMCIPGGDHRLAPHVESMADRMVGFFEGLAVK